MTAMEKFHIVFKTEFSIRPLLMPEVFYVFYPKKLKQYRPDSLPNWIKNTGFTLCAAISNQNLSLESLVS